MKKIILTLMIGLVISVSAYAQKAHRVVIQINSADTTVWHGAMRNIANMQTALGNNTQIEVVAHGSGIGLLIASKTTQQAKIVELAAMGVKFVACENTIRERKIDKATILPQSGFVPSGVSEIILKQEEGWAYLKY